MLLHLHNYLEGDSKFSPTPIIKRGEDKMNGPSLSHGDFPLRN